MVCFVISGNRTLELVRGIHNIEHRHHGCVLTIGKFDGVHQGHKAVLNNLIEQAKRLNLPSAVMVFEPQPEEVFVPDKAPARLSSLRDKYEQLRDIGIDRLICVRFDTKFASQTPEQFVEALLVNQLGVKFLVVGDDFRFGCKRLGDFEFLRQSSTTFGFEVVSTQSYRLKNCRISSTEIRDALSTSRFKDANEMLGRAYAIKGRVVHGEKNGRTIGFPTANVIIKHKKAPVHGVFAVVVQWQNERRLGIANLGKRPTLHGKRMQLEVHIFDFKDDLYGKRICIEFVAKIRDEQKFKNIDELKEQIKLDVKQAKRLLKI